MTYDTGYPTEPIGKGNPYYRCSYCKRSVPEINGNIFNHESWCKYRTEKESGKGHTEKLILTYNYSQLVKVELKGEILYEVDLSPKPYWEVCWAHGWAGDYPSEEAAQNDCMSLLGYTRSTRVVNPGDAGYENPEITRITTKEYIL